MIGEQKKEESQEIQKEKPKEIPKIKEENKKVSKNHKRAPPSKF